MDVDGTLAPKQENDMTTLTHAIIEWRNMKEKCDSAKEELRENNKSMKILEDVILRIMKNHNIGVIKMNFHQEMFLSLVKEILFSIVIIVIMNFRLNHQVLYIIILGVHIVLIKDYVLTIVVKFVLINHLPH